LSLVERGWGWGKGVQGGRKKGGREEGELRGGGMERVEEGWMFV
jgi:hypothetical protein